MTVAGIGSSEPSKRDSEYMMLALMLARRGLGTTMPNPGVGAVIVRPGAGQGCADEVVGRGWTQPGGRPHAEVGALRRAGDRARGATLYVTLEPCSHHGRSPPCADAVIAAGIERVVVGVGDPDDRVAGQGILRLREAGIEVVEDVQSQAARAVTAGHICRITQNRPVVQVKLAVSANDLVSHASGGAPVWVTGPAARNRVHMMRARSDAVLTGIGTVLTDDPELTCRLPGMGDYSPVRVVLDTTLRLPLTSRLAQTARDVPVWVICANRPAGDKAAALEALGVEVIQVEADHDTRSGGGRPAWHAVMAELAQRGVTRLMVEAGPRVARSLDRETRLVDEYVLFRGSTRLAEDQGTPLREIWASDQLAEMNRNDARSLPGGDEMTIYRKG